MKRILWVVIVVLTGYNASAQNSMYEWVNLFTVNSASSIQRDIATDSKSNSYSIGYFWGNLDADPGIGTFSLTSTSPACYIIKLDSIGNFIWGKQIAGTNTTEGNKIDIDRYDNIYVCGSFKGVVDFDPNAGVFNLSSNGLEDAFVSKLDTAGNLIWAKQIGSLTKDVAIAVKADSIGNVYLSGTFTGTVDVNPDAGNYNFTSNGSDDAFTIKLNKYGNFLWAAQFGGGSSEGIVDLAVDHIGNVATIGKLYGVVDLNPGVGVLNFGLTNRSSSFIAKLDSGGFFSWANTIDIGTPGGALYPASAAFDSQGNLYTTGAFFDVVDFDPGPTTYTVAETNTYGTLELYILKLDPLGNFVWVKTNEGNSAGNVQGGAIDLNSAGDIFIAGQLDNRVVDFDPSAGVYNMDGNYGQIFVLALSANGAFIWAKQFGGIGANAADLYTMHVDSRSNVYTGGRLLGVVDFDPGALTYTLSSIGGGGYNAFIHKMGLCNMTPAPAVNTTSIANQVICQNNSTILSVSSAGNNYWFMSATGTTFLTAGNTYTTPVFNFPGIYRYYAEVNTCAVSATRTAISFTVIASPSLTVVSSSSIVCNGSSVNLISAGANTYTWSTGATSSSVNVIPPINTTYTVVGTGSNSCISTKTINVSVSNTCADVWPGDANSDGVADNLDVLELGLHYTQTGVSRASISNTWQSYFANNWTGAISNGGNLNHADCNGDGTINDDDTLAIYNNYGLTHAFKPAQTNIINPQLSIVPDQAMVTKGNWGTASIYLGDATANINNINGVAFTVDFDNTLIESSNVWIEYQNSFMDAGQNLHFKKLDFMNSKLFTASTHTVSNNVSGFGKIATLHYQILSSLTTDQVLNIGLSQSNQSEASGNITPLTSGTGTLMAIGASVGIQENSFGSNVLISPNPTNALLNISFNTIPQNTKIELYNSIGALVLTKEMSNKNNTINVSELSSGIYFMKVLEGNNVVAVKKVVRE